MFMFQLTSTLQSRAFRVVLKNERVEGEGMCSSTLCFAFLAPVSCGRQWARTERRSRRCAWISNRPPSLC